MEDLRSKLRLADATLEGTLLLGTAPCLSKTAVKYSEPCPLVAIFDYHKFVLFMLPVRRDLGNTRGLYHKLSNEQIGAATLGGVAYEDIVSCIVFD